MRSAISLFFSFRPGARREVAGLVVLMLLITGTYVGQGLLIAGVLAEAFTGASIAGLLAPLAGIAALQVVRIGAIIIRDTWAFRVSAKVKEAVRSALMVKLEELGPGQVQRMRTGDVQTTVVDSVELLDPLIGRFLPAVYGSAIGATVAGAFVIAVDPVVGSIVLICAMLAPLSTLVGSRWIHESGDRWSVSYRRLYSENIDAVQGMATLKAFNASERRGRELAVRAESFCRDSVRLTWAWCASASVGEILVPLGSAAAIGLGSWRAAQGDLSVVGLFTILMLTRETFRPMQELQAAYHAAYSAIPASRAVADLLLIEPVVADTATVAPPMPDGPPGLEFRDVRFTYATRNTPALDGFSLTIEPGERVALVGRSGAGKSTIVSLLMRYFDPDSGSLALGGRDIRDFPLADLRSRIGVVAQDTYLFHGTVRDNLLLADPAATDDDLTRAAEAAQAQRFIEALPHGYDTVIGERGMKLSGGERQRIAIARALLKDAPVLVLDEPTSAIDAANEASITQALSDLTRGRTTIVIAHRLSTVRNADRIVVLDSGRVVEAGAHAELIEREGGAYAELVATQGAASR